MTHDLSPWAIEIFSQTVLLTRHIFLTISHCLSLTSITVLRKDQKKVDKLNAQIPYHEGRGNKDEVGKIKEQIDAIWEKAREAQFA